MPAVRDITWLVILCVPVRQLDSGMEQHPPVFVSAVIIIIKDLVRVSLFMGRMCFLLQ